MGNHSVQHPLKVLQRKLFDYFHQRAFRSYTDSIINPKTYIKISNLGEQLVSLVEHQHFAFAHIRHLAIQHFRQDIENAGKRCHLLGGMAKPDLTGIAPASPLGQESCQGWRPRGEPSRRSS